MVNIISRPHKYTFKYFPVHVILILVTSAVAVVWGYDIMKRKLRNRHRSFRDGDTNYGPSEVRATSGANLGRPLF